MKFLTLFTLLLLGCATNATIDKKPNGEQVLASLFEASGRNLENEPLCNMESVSNPKVPYTLKDQLSVVLSPSYDNENKTNIQTNCNPSKHDADNNQVMDIWDCALIVSETSSAGEFISSSTIALDRKSTRLKV